VHFAQHSGVYFEVLVDHATEQLCAAEVYADDLAKPRRWLATGHSATINRVTIGRYGTSPVGNLLLDA
jgi:ATP phosphoribosyltransferase regulatory subunit HisZ